MTHTCSISEKAAVIHGAHGSYDADANYYLWRYAFPRKKASGKNTLSFFRSCNKKKKVSGLSNAMSLKSWECRVVKKSPF